MSTSPSEPPWVITQRMVVTSLRNETICADAPVDSIVVGHLLDHQDPPTMVGRGSI